MALLRVPEAEGRRRALSRVELDRLAAVGPVVLPDLAERAGTADVRRVLADLGEERGCVDAFASFTQIQSTLTPRSWASTSSCHGSTFGLVRSSSVFPFASAASSSTASGAP